MQIRLASVMVENQDSALRFYTTILGFVKNKDIPMGPRFRWLTVSAPEGAEGVELVLEAMAFPPAQTYQKAFAAGIPATGFITNDIHSEYNRLKSLGVTFRGEPKKHWPHHRRSLRGPLRQPHQPRPTGGLTPRHSAI
jgi:catechol 2,3-dioxygenase-like lactoylglutathione lyase family enzyme